LNRDVALSPRCGESSQPQEAANQLALPCRPEINSSLGNLSPSSVSLVFN
jgi:hypothetical protein